MIDKRVASAAEAVADVFDGATVMIGGFGEAGSPIELIHALIDQGATNLTVINNNTGSGEVGLAAGEGAFVHHQAGGFVPHRDLVVGEDYGQRERQGGGSGQRGRDFRMVAALA